VAILGAICGFVIALVRVGRPRATRSALNKSSRSGV